METNRDIAIEQVSKKRELLVGGGVEIEQVRQAFEAAREGYHLGLRDFLTVKMLERKFNTIDFNTVTKAVSGFWGRRFPEEVKEAIQIEKDKLKLEPLSEAALHARTEGVPVMDTERETIGTESGTWIYEYKPKEFKATEEVSQLVYEGLQEAMKQNEEGLRRIFEKNKSVIKEAFDVDSYEVFRTKYFEVWKDLLPKVRDDETGQGFKDWNIFFDSKKGEYVPRDRIKLG